MFQRIGKMPPQGRYVEWVCNKRNASNYGNFHGGFIYRCAKTKLQQLHVVSQ